MLNTSVVPFGASVCPCATRDDTPNRINKIVAPPHPVLMDASQLALSYRQPDERASDLVTDY